MSESVEQKPMNNIMLDLETLGTRPGSVIATIGAVKFDGTGLGDTFYRRVDLESCADLGLAVDAATVQWWLCQSDAARAEMTAGGRVPLDVVLAEFADWAGKPDTVWGNGAAFDNVLLSEAYVRARIRRPWKYKADRCYRTALTMFPEAIPSQLPEIPHHALEDAVTQAKHLIKILGGNIR